MSTQQIVIDMVRIHYIIEGKYSHPIDACFFLPEQQKQFDAMKSELVARKQVFSIIYERKFFRREKMYRAADRGDADIMLTLVRAEAEGVNTRASYSPCDPDWTED